MIKGVDKEWEMLVDDGFRITMKVDFNGRGYELNHNGVFAGRFFVEYFDAYLAMLKIKTVERGCTCGMK